MTVENREVLLLLDDPKPDANYGEPYTSMRLTLRAVEMEDGHVRNIGNGWGRANRAFADFAITAYVRSNDDAGFTYGWHADYLNVYSLDLESAEIKVKHLRRVEKGLRRMDTEFGHVQTFGEYVARVAHILGIKRFGRTARRGSGRTYDDNEYLWMNASGVISYLDTIVREFQTKEVTV